MKSPHWLVVTRRRLQTGLVFWMMRRWNQYCRQCEEDCRHHRCHYWCWGYSPARTPWRTVASRTAFVDGRAFSSRINYSCRGMQDQVIALNSPCSISSFCHCPLLQILGAAGRVVVYCSNLRLGIWLLSSGCCPSLQILDPACCMQDLLIHFHLSSL